MERHRVITFDNSAGFVLYTDGWLIGELYRKHQPDSSFFNILSSILNFIHFWSKTNMQEEMKIIIEKGGGLIK